LGLPVALLNSLLGDLTQHQSLHRTKATNFRLSDFSSIACLSKQPISSPNQPKSDVHQFLGVPSHNFESISL
jgi:hypothetical protein